MFQSFSYKCKNLLRQSCPKEFIRFLCKCIEHLLERKLQRAKRYHMAKFQREVRLFFLKSTTCKQRREVLGAEKGLQLLKVFTIPVIIICVDMQQFVLIPDSVHNNTRIFQSIKLTKIPHTKITRSKTKLKRTLFAKSNSYLAKLCLVHVSSSQSR